MKVVFELDPEEYELLKKSFSKSRREMTGPEGDGPVPGSKAILLYQARVMLKTGPAGIPEGRVEKTEPLETVLYQVCPSCREAQLRTDEGPVPVPIEVVERFEDEAKKVVIRPADEAEKPAGPESKAIDRPTPPALREKVLHRDGLVCANPFCRRRLGLEADHLTERSKGGRTDLKGLNGLCKGCHFLKTQGLLIIRRDRDGNLVFERKSDDLTASILKAAEEELSRMPRLAAIPTRVGGEPGSLQSERVMRSMKRMGIAEAAARSRLAAAVERFREAGRAPTDDELLREALSRC